MKKIISTILVCVLLIGTVFTLASCFAPNSDPSKAKAALEDKGYKVTKVDADGNILEAGTIALMKLAGIDDIDSVITAENGSENVVIIYFEDKDAAEEEFEDVQEYAGDKECKKSGNMIYYGTEAGIKAAR